MHEQAQMIEQQARQARGGAGGAPAAGGAAPQAVCLFFVHFVGV
jgi:hypothetical protein